MWSEERQRRRDSSFHEEGGVYFTERIHFLYYRQSVSIGFLLKDGVSYILYVIFLVEMTMICLWFVYKGLLL